MQDLENQTDEEIVKTLFHDRPLAIEMLCKVVSKSGQVLDFKLWNGQQKFIKWKRFCVAQTSRMTLLVPKLRQGGITTCSIADSLLDANFKMNSDSTFLIKSDEDRELMFDRLKFMEKRLPNEFRLHKVRDQSKAIKYSDPQNSSVRILGAGASEAQSSKKGRSSTVQYLHVTEAAYIEHLGKLMQGARGSVATDGCIVLETTMNGPQGYFYQQCMDVLAEGHELERNVWRKGNTIMLFLPYFEHTEYRSQVTENFELRDDTEIKLRELGACNEAIAWRRIEIEEASHDDKSGATPEEMFNREYPADLMDGFLASGRNYFDMDILHANKMFAKASKEKPLQVGIDHMSLDWVVKSRLNTTTIWNLPAKGWKHRYMFVMDCGEGSTQSDPDCGYMFDRVLRKVVARQFGRFGCFAQVEQGISLCKIYNDAWITWDRTGIGADRLPLLVQSEYPNIIDRMPPDPTRINNVDGWGIKWNRENRPYALTLMKDAVENKQWDVPDEEFWVESEHFQWPENGSGSPAAGQGFHDDRVMALALIPITEVLIPAPKRIENKEKTKANLSATNLMNEQAPKGNW